MINAGSPGGDLFRARYYIHADDVLRAFRGDELRLFIAAASITIGLVAVAFSLIRQRFDRLLSFFAWFSALYGAQLWMQSSMHSLMAHPSPLLDKVQMALEFFVSIPAFQFFGVSGLVGRTGRAIVYLVCLVEVCLIGAIFLGLPLQLLDHLNSVCIIAGFTRYPGLPRACGRKGLCRISRWSACLCGLCSMDKWSTSSRPSNID
jgi:hypothetical protein